MQGCVIETGTGLVCKAVKVHAACMRVEHLSGRKGASAVQACHQPTTCFEDVAVMLSLSGVSCYGCFRLLDVS
jgi:hypothetical protein